MEEPIDDPRHVSERAECNPTLTIVSITKNSLSDLQRTVASVREVAQEGIEYIVIDGASEDGTVLYLDQEENHWIRWISERDCSLYDAMNKGLSLATKDYVLFLNAGDVLHPTFAWHRFVSSRRATNGAVLIGRTIEVFERLFLLRPGYTRADLALVSPPHQATFYPISFAKNERFRIDRPVGADSEYTRRAIRLHGGCFVPQVVAIFSLGGLSSSYDSFTALRLRMQESRNLRARTKLLIKFLLYNTVPREAFYRLLAFGKYTRLATELDIREPED